MDKRRQLGQWAEQAASRLLEVKGYQIIDRNWRCRYGEIDLIAIKNQFLIFVEVRSRSSTRFGTAAEAIDWRKQQKVRAIAQFYLHSKRLSRYQVRFDAIAVQWIKAPDDFELSHFEGVF